MHIKRHTEMLKRVLIPVFILLALGIPWANIMPIAIILLTPNIKAATGRRRRRKVASVTVLATRLPEESSYCHTGRR
ncbi:unnamed protein product [Didymodactylos carnosus]|uniref:Uncharacterized protein n=1 Tax=Didymodactylos carnosus TaxID=1234261 RepID=A0A815DS08_9BILA|nr:unnamed protein product [Didymodactylos carnosus]CAF4128291.1 unnamed protein product [Didymodactylos carnosus]